MVEVAQVLKTYIMTDGCDRAVGVDQQVAGEVNAQVCDVLRWRDAEVRFEGTTHVFRRAVRQPHQGGPPFDDMFL